MKKGMQIALVCAALIGGGPVQAGVLEELGRAAASVGGDAQPVLVLGPGIKMNIGDRIVGVSGYDKCPLDWLDKAKGQPALDGCVVLNKPLVSVVFDDKTKEQWTVKKDGQRTTLVRPNGTQVTQAN